MLIGFIDIIIIGLIIYLNYYLWKEKPLKILEWLIISFCTIAFFLIVFPYISTESERVIFNWLHRDEIVDGFEGVYIFLRWPFYWWIGVLELLYLLIITFGFRNLGSS